MSKYLSRLLIFAIGVPAIIALIVFLPQANHLAANSLVVLVSSLGAMEFARLLRKKGYEIGPMKAALIGAIPSLSVGASVSFGLPLSLDTITMTLAGLFILGSGVFGTTSSFSDFLERVLAGFAVLIYPGFLMAWVTKINALPNATYLLLVYVVIVFGNDSAAWAAGMLWGAGNRGFLASSPNKSVAGFLGGIAASVIVGVASVFLFPSVFSSKIMPSALAASLLGLVVGIAAIIGDLAESTLKRSAEVKDSGTLIPGRGGVLDSIDSLAFAAPVFVCMFNLLFS